MPRNMNEIGSRFLNRTQAQFNASAAFYIRGAMSIPVSATEGRFSHDVIDEENIVVTEVMSDFLIPAADLVHDGTRITPQAGDRITKQTPSGLVTYLVATPRQGDQCWSYSGVGEVRVRIHTRRI